MALPTGSNGPAARRQAALLTELRGAAAYYQRGQVDRAETSCRSILRRDPAQGDALHLLGLIASGRGRWDDAVALLEQAARALPGNAEVQSNLGNALRSRGRVPEALAAYRHALVLVPGHLASRFNLAQCLIQAGEYTEALALCRLVAAAQPGFADAQAAMGQALRGLGRAAEAEAALRRALALRPDFASAHADLGTLLGEAGRFNDALAHHQHALALNPRDAGFHASLAQTLHRQNEFPAAEASYRAALALAPGEARLWNELGRVLRALGAFDDADVCFRRALEIEPDLADARRNRGLIGRTAMQDAELTRLETLLNGAAPDVMTRVAAGFALGKYHDDQGMYDTAFKAYALANSLFREERAAMGQRHDPRAFRASVDAILAGRPVTSVPAVANAAAAEDGRALGELPVFIVGMPRSGTSLIEQIAASHPLVHGAGELPAIGRIASSLAGGDTAAADAIRAHVLDLRRRGGHHVRVIDKMPDNVFHLDLIARLFPGARVILCRRDARDTSLSCYFQLFANGNLFSYDLADCGSRHRDTGRVMDDWASNPGLTTLDLRYEAFIGDLEGESRRLISFLGLPWDDACLGFHQTNRAVATASGWQVRQPLYVSAVGRWRHYERHLGPLIAALKA
jgi:tetratricopeptide (TPR) repeat protein